MITQCWTLWRRPVRRPIVHTVAVVRSWAPRQRRLSRWGSAAAQTCRRPPPPRTKTIRSTWAWRPAAAQRPMRIDPTARWPEAIWTWTRNGSASPAKRSRKTCIPDPRRPWGTGLGRRRTAVTGKTRRRATTRRSNEWNSRGPLLWTWRQKFRFSHADATAEWQSLFCLLVLLLEPEREGGQKNGIDFNYINCVAS